jgi:heptosyltransferase II
MAVTQCRHFSGYKPCGKNAVCDSSCSSKDIPQTRILVVHLEALGAVLRSTSLLIPLKRKFPSSHITWVTKKPAQSLLENNPYIDQVLTIDTEDLLRLSTFDFDFGFCIDKSQVASGIMKQINVDAVFGFTTDSRSAAIVPATPAADQLWQLGLDNNKKFFENQLPETQLVTEALELEYKRDPYLYFMTEVELSRVSKLRRIWGSPIIGLNTGCSSVISAKKLTVERHRELIAKLKPFGKIVLLGGGPEDDERNRKIAEGLDVIQTPCLSGLRDGMISAAACDIIVTGDSLGMHMGIALQKWIVAWFGPTCEQEIDLYGRGVKLKTPAACSPCWSRTCSKDPMCYDLVAPEDLKRGVLKGLNWLTSSSKQPISEISY